MILKNLFNPGFICNLKLKNRVILPAMATALCEPGGIVSEELIEYHIARSKGGCGFSIVELSAVHPSTIGKGKFGLGIFDDKFIPGLIKLSNAIKNAGGTPAIQLWHAGRQINSQDVFTDYIVSPSSIPCPVCKEKPKELSILEIEEMVDAYGDSALRAKEAGFEAVEIHGAHGYLICQFLSHYSNKRDDRYGGSLNNRTRFATEIIDNVKEKTGSKFPLIFRLSSEEYVDGGLDIEQVKQISKILESSGVDAIHVSAGNYETFHYAVPPVEVPVALNVGRASDIKKIVDIPIIVAGRINDPLVADKIISDNQADFISVGRGQLADPDFCNKSMNDDFDSILKCIACNQGCIDRLFFEKKHISCLLNPACGREKQYNLKPGKTTRKILIAGGGPGGLEAAKLLALAGYRVNLYEKSNNFGGQFALSGAIPGKEIFSESIQKMVNLAKKAGASLEMQTEVNRKVIDENNPDIIIIATGSSPFVPDINIKDSNGKSIDNNCIITVHDILKGIKSTEGYVTIIGGGTTGMEAAVYLAEQGKKVTVLEISDEVAGDLGPLRKPFLLEKIKKLGIVIYTNTKCISIDDSFIEVEMGGSNKKLKRTGSVVFACGVKPEKNLEELLKSSRFQYYVIGDAYKPGKAIDAIWNAADVALKIYNSDSKLGTNIEMLSEETISELVEEITKQIMKYI